MPTVYRDEDTGAKIYKNTKSEKDIDIIRRKIDILDKKLDRVINLLQMMINDENDKNSI